MSASPTADGPARLPALTVWLVLIVASIGFLFDTYELLMTPLVLGPALSELLKLPQNHPDVTAWVGRVLWITALCGGIFGLLGGWLVDRLGRKTVMAASIFLYSFSPVMAAFSTDLTWLLVFRCTTFVGVCVEFVAAVTWLAELFPDHKTKERVLGWTQAFASFGGLLVTAISAGITVYVASLPNIGLPTPAPWRYLLLTGLLPAIPIALMLPFVPESPEWLRRRREGTLRRPSFAELFSPALARTTIVSTLLSACAYAAAFGLLQVTVTQGVPGLKIPAIEARPEETPENEKRLKLLGEGNATPRTELAKVSAQLRKMQDAKETDTDAFRDALKRQGALQVTFVQPVREHVQFLQETGGLLGRILLAVALVYVASRRVTLWLFQVPGLVVVPAVWFWMYGALPEWFAYGVFLAGMCIVAQFSYFGEYLPRVFPPHLRGTGGAFATNVGGRMIGTLAALVTTTLSVYMPSKSQFDNVVMAAGIVGTVVFVVGFLGSFFLPQPKAAE